MRLIHPSDDAVLRSDASRHSLNQHSVLGHAAVCQLTNLRPVARSGAVGASRKCPDVDDVSLDNAAVEDPFSGGGVRREREACEG
ncbi:hypothetical protein TcBrA4_0092160 [Trypanosoma cruzi]|nr:hypothetical protein TcBrA4_0092160 [Trypanosoma cruzi]